MKNFSVVILFYLGCIYSCAPLSPFSPRNAPGFILRDQVLNRPNEPGKCYAKCKENYSPNSIVVELPEYLGSEDLSMDHFRDTSFVVAAKGTEWIKKKVDGCRGNSDDCYVWCLHETKEEVVQVKYLSKTANLNAEDWQMSEFIIEGAPKEGNFTWKEVVCQNKINAQLENKVAERLQLEFGEEIPKEISLKREYIKSNLLKYQEEYGLAIGGFTIETLQHLGLK